MNRAIIPVGLVVFFVGLWGGWCLGANEFRRFEEKCIRQGIAERVETMYGITVIKWKGKG